MLAPRATVLTNRERLALVGAVWMTAAVAWVALARAASTAGAHHGHDHGAAALGAGGSAGLVLFTVTWTVMCVAMMLPTSLPVLTMFHALVGQRPARVRLVSLVACGYLAIWTMAGAVVYPLVVALGRVVDVSPWLATEHGTSAAILLVAGAFQLTPLKYRCLDKCRSPFGFIVQHWQGGRETWQAFRLGLDHGLFCVGCCWALMLLMFGVGAGSLAWMATLGIVMSIEKNATWGRRLTAPLGVGLIAWGVGLVALA